jgi:hypothetical protein
VKGTESPNYKNLENILYLELYTNNEIQLTASVIGLDIFSDAFLIIMCGMIGRVSFDLV